MNKMVAKMFVLRSMCMNHSRPLGSKQIQTGNVERNQPFLLPLSAALGPFSLSNSPRNENKENNYLFVSAFSFAAFEYGQRFVRDSCNEFRDWPLSLARLVLSILPISVRAARFGIGPGDGIQSPMSACDAFFLPTNRSISSSALHSAPFQFRRIKVICMKMPWTKFLECLRRPN